ncbi:MAG TPA: RelA/SpoT domain-containing protein [Methylomirabilota bacterium]|nr:RelA/SpoT domain-containing protein [Methylomirabilota bacterium]
MSWIKPEFNRDEINRAGEILISHQAAPMDELNNALKIINNWRAIHACPLQSIKMTLSGRAKKQDTGALIAQRTKRLPAIILKLRKNHEEGLTMKLSQMHDIGGCRAVLRSVSQAEDLTAVYEKATIKNALRGGKFHRKYDYIKNPKDSEYRSIHLVYKYHSDSKKLAIYNDLKIEIQIRSKLQHAWATAVETVDFFTGQALKSNIGEVSWKRFFALASNEFARIEKRPLVPGTPENEAESRKELQSYVAQISLLEGLRTATGIVTTGLGGVSKDGHFFLLQLNLQNRTIQTTTFRQNQAAEAQEKYLEAEKNNRDRPMQTVLVSVDSLAALPKAYPSFYLDISEFVRVLNKILGISKVPDAPSAAATV